MCVLRACLFLNLFSARNQTVFESIQNRRLLYLRYTRKGYIFLFLLTSSLSSIFKVFFFFFHCDGANTHGHTHTHSHGLPVKRKTNKTELLDGSSYNRQHTTKQHMNVKHAVRNSGLARSRIFSRPKRCDRHLPNETSNMRGLEKIEKFLCVLVLAARFSFETCLEKENKNPLYGSVTNRCKALQKYTPKK